MKRLTFALTIFSTLAFGQGANSPKNETNMNDFFKTLYHNFNDRKIDLVISCMTPDVKWANGMDGGFVYGHDGVKAYWTRQFTMVSSNVTPMEIAETDGVWRIKIHQVVHDLAGKLLADETVTHRFTLADYKIALFEIEK